jgi:F0F1-type ATP synthase membrane subunit b/b'
VTAGIERELSEADRIREYKKKELDVALEELMGEIEETLRKMNANFKKKTERRVKRVKDVLRVEWGRRTG